MPYPELISKKPTREHTITLTVNNRPHYLRRALQSLSQVRGIAGWHLFIGLEPGSRECARVCHGIDFMPHTILHNEAPLGIRGNPYNVLDYAFKQGSLLNIYLEDDLLVSPDVADLALWYGRLISEDVLHDIKVMFMSLFVTSTGGEPIDEIVASQFFSPWGLVINRFQWLNHIKPFWWNDEHSFPHMKDWTLSLAEHLKYPLMLLAPRLSRTANIGREGGVHSIPERHDLLVQGLAMNRSAGPFAYRINPTAQPHWRKLNYQTMTIEGEQ
jgi:hypothetical protein